MRIFALELRLKPIIYEKTIRFIAAVHGIFGLHDPGAE
jgi:hypothetical protein